ncbi:carbohydrate-binding protein [Paenibacillus barcinonensis]|uniref:Carbohydrate-binding protein n=1 Tax=Paenibacillus barcinonensis TaxID=198119 RepID=A0A2V4W9W7_PAEBA|nr:glycosyl hydrolase family 30 [Paenibacillus barcinonensis]QKS55098.1 carbohydrate-binding protein [Paenibacillus barcinonensis]
MNSLIKKSLCTMLAAVTALPLFYVPVSSNVMAANDVVVNTSSTKQTIRGFGGMTHSGWIGDLTAAERETAFGNGADQLGFSVLRIPIDENKNNWQREVATAKKAIEHGAIVFASPWNPPSDMTEIFTLNMSSGGGSTYEAESTTTLSGGASVDTAFTGYTGTGYVSFQNPSGSAAQFNTILIGSTGTKNIKIRYSLPSGTSNVDVYVNGSLALSSVPFEATGSGSTWKEKSIQVPMVNGTSTLKFVTTGTGGPNLDNINVTAFVQDTQAKRLKYDKYEAYAQYLNEFDTFMKNNGVNLYAISVQNEPDYAHDWTWWSPEEMLRFMKENAGSINNRVIAPESFSYVKTMSDPLLNDPQALANMDILGAHTYGTQYSDFPYPLFEQKGAGKELWMTEVYYPNSETNSADRWPEALGVAEHMYNAMVEGNFQTYVWWYIRRHYGPIKEDGTISKRGYSMAHYSKFVRPGDVRVDATKNPVNGVYVSAYKGENNKIVIVAINKNTSVVNQRFTVQQAVTSTVSSWITDSTRNLAAGSPLQVSGNGFTANLPAQSVTTFVIQP